VVVVVVVVVIVMVAAVISSSQYFCTFNSSVTYEHSNDNLPYLITDFFTAYQLIPALHGRC
jgi:hypothetical protein